MLYIRRSAYQVVPVPSMSLPHRIQRISAHRRVAAAPLAVTTGSKHARDEMMSSSSRKHISNTVGINGKERVLVRVSANELLLHTRTHARYTTDVRIIQSTYTGIGLWLSMYVRAKPSVAYTASMRTAVYNR